MVAEPDPRRNSLAAGRRAALTRPRTLAAVGVVALLGVGAAAAWKFWLVPSQPPPPVVKGAPVDDPRLTYATPYRNVRPDVKYVGDAVCAECHFAHVESYREHPMGRSFFPVAQAPPLERYDAGALVSFEARGAHYAVERRGDKVFHKQTYRDGDGKVAAELELEVHYAMGSGRQGRTYLLRRGDQLVQSPISWYSHEGNWALSPGYDKTTLGFSRRTTARCVFCHCNDADHVEHTVNRYRPPIFRQHALGCERCHGPGELHVQKRRGGDESAGLDDTIVNPARLEPALREAVCQQCHLQGEGRIVRRGRGDFDFRPGLPLHLFLSAFVRPPGLSEAHRSVGHTEQMYLSRCFQKSGGKLGCISCHDPHTLPAEPERVTYYRDRCLQCHGETSCSLPPVQRRQQNKDDSCVACHMPAGSSTNIVHAAVTDHRILRKPDSPPAPPPRKGPVDIPLEYFHSHLVAADDPEVARDLGLAIILNARPAPARLRPVLGQAALPFLEVAASRDPDDVAALEALGAARFYTGRVAAALSASEAALTRAPKRETALEDAAYFASKLGQPDKAIGYWKRLLDVNPWEADTHYNLGKLLLEQGDVEGALREARAALAIDPAGVEARTLIVSYHLQRGEREQARAEFARVLALKPSQEEDLRRWFEQQMR